MTFAKEHINYYEEAEADLDGYIWLHSRLHKCRVLKFGVSRIVCGG